MSGSGRGRGRGKKTQSEAPQPQNLPPPATFVAPQGPQQPQVLPPSIWDREGYAATLKNLLDQGQDPHHPSVIAEKMAIAGYIVTGQQVQDRLRQTQYSKNSLKKSYWTVYSCFFLDKYFEVQNQLQQVAAPQPVNPHGGREYRAPPQPEGTQPLFPDPRDDVIMFSDAGDYEQLEGPCTVDYFTWKRYRELIGYKVFLSLYPHL